MNLTLNEIMEKAIPHFRYYYLSHNNDISVELLRIILISKCNIKLSYIKLFKLRNLIKKEHPELFKRDKD